MRYMNFGQYAPLMAELRAKGWLLKEIAYEVYKRCGHSPSDATIVSYAKPLRKQSPYVRKRPEHTNALLTELRERRLLLDMTTHEVNRLVGSSCYISQLEFAKKSPTLPTLEKWVSALGGQLKVEWSSPTK